MVRLFGTDGVRGEANIFPMDAATALAIGQAIAAHYKPVHTKGRIVIGQDTRISGDMLAHAVAAGICGAGLDVDLLGVLPTPGIAHMTVATSAAAGVVISASHNPFSDNGIKVFGPSGYKPSNQDEERIEALVFDSEHVVKANAMEIGRLGVIWDATEHYLEFLIPIANLSLNGLTLVLDCANGATYQTAPELFKRLGAKVIALFGTPNGININDRCGSQHPQKLAATVVAHKADLGLAFDGDGDRLVAVDETGQILSGDQIMAICAKHLHETGQLKNNIVVSTVMSNLGFHLAMKKMGIQLATTQVGDRQVIAKMVDADATLGGEDSGHIIFRDVHTTGDGLVAAIKLIQAMRSSRQPLSHLSRVMQVFPQVLINVDVRQKPDLTMVPQIAHAIREAEQALGDQGRVLVRYSGTQNQCRIMAEGPTRDLTERVCSQIAEVVTMTIGSLS